MSLNQSINSEDKIMSNDKAKQDTEKALILTKLNEAIGAINTIQGSVHNVLVMSSCYAFKYNDTSIIIKVLSNLTNVRGSFRVESVAYWFKHIAGLNASFNEKKNEWACKFNKSGEYASDQDVAFTYDKAHIALLKQDKFKFWVIAPKQIMNLKLNTELEKITGSAEIMLARAVAAGKLSDADISLHLANMLQRIQQIASTGKTKEWLEEYYLQHPDQKPVVELSDADKELAELEALYADEIEVTA
jgi:hypothetical protein